jgi:hypothetical protein
MGLAFEMALVALRLADRGDPANEVVAHKVIDLAKAGERDPERLCEASWKNYGRSPTPIFFRLSPDCRRLNGSWAWASPANVPSGHMDMAQVDGLDVPVDFPTSQFEAVQNTVVAYSGHNHHRLFLYALRAISHRFTAMAEYDTRLTASIRTHGTGPGQPFRYEQERDLFGFL